MHVRPGRDPRQADVSDAISSLDGVASANRQRKDAALENYYEELADDSG
jgi:hypothetical protein